MQHPFIIKTANKLNRRELPRFDEDYKQFRTNIMLYGKRLNVLPLKSRTRKGCPFIPLVFNIVLEDQAWNNKKEK